MGDIDVGRKAMKYFRYPPFDGSVKWTLVCRVNRSFGWFDSFAPTINPTVQGTVTMTKENWQKIEDVFGVGTTPFFSDDKGGEK